MQRVAKYASPIIVLLGLLIFESNRTRLVLPVLVEILVVSFLYFVCRPLREKAHGEGFLLFWLSPLTLFWLLSERHEGRDIGPLSIQIELALAGVGTALLLMRNSLSKPEWRLIFFMLLTWAVAYLSGSTGGADHMTSYFNFLHLTVDQLNDLIKAIRKTIHVSFYGGLTWLIATYLWNSMPTLGLKWYFPIAFSFTIAYCDEYRQSMMPNRSGSVWDVLLDMSATFFVLVLLQFADHRKQRNSDEK